MTRVGIVFFCLALGIWIPNSSAEARDVKISEHTSYYSISGRTAADFAVSMSRRGPYSRQHRKRAWATASRKMSYQLTKRKRSGSCRVARAEVRLKIVYKMPKPRSLNGVSRRQRAKWTKLYRLLDRHERTHGRFYRQFAKSVQRSLRKLTARNCQELDRKADRLVKQLSAKDSARNDRFDRRDGRTYRRVERIYTSS